MLRVSTNSSQTSLHLRPCNFVNFDQIHISNSVFSFKTLIGPSSAFIFFPTVLTTRTKVNHPFLPNIPILYPLKITENQRFSGVSREYQMGTLLSNGLSVTFVPYRHQSTDLHCLAGHHVNIGFMD